MKGADGGVWCWACKLLSKQRRMVIRIGIKWGEVVRPMMVAPANCGQDPQWHYTQWGSAVLVMFTACSITGRSFTRTTEKRIHDNKLLKFQINSVITKWRLSSSEVGEGMKYKKIIMWWCPLATGSICVNSWQFWQFNVWGGGGGCNKTMILLNNF